MEPKLAALQPITLVVHEEDTESRYETLILDLAPGRVLRVGTPLREGEEVQFAPGTEMNVVVAQPEAMYHHRTRLREQRTTHPDGLMLEWPWEVRRVQRRSDVRVDVKLPALVQRVTSRGERGAALKGHTADLSAGGVRLVLREPLAARTRVEISMELPEEGPVRAEGAVVRSGELHGGKEEQFFWNAVEFTEIDAVARRAVTRFVFDVQREQHRRRAL